MEYRSSSPWGVLIGEDKKAKPLLQSLYRAIVHHIIYNIEPRTVRSLTPTKLAAFYRECGGDLDAFFNSDVDTISKVFTTLGCVHSLLPDPKDDFSPPRVPALHPRGFERWQTIQLLMEPDEHSTYIQEAVKKFGLLDPENQDSFAYLGPIPRDAFPLEQDEETMEWHKSVFLKRIRDEEEREKAAEEEKLNNGANRTGVPGGGGPEDVSGGDERNVSEEAEEELDMKPERMRRPYSRAHSRHSSGDRTAYAGYSSSYDGRGRSPMPPNAADRGYSRSRHASQYSQRYATPDPSDVDERVRSRKGSHVQYVFEDDAASVRSVSPGFTHDYAQSAATHHPVRKGRGRVVSGEHHVDRERAPSVRGRSAEPPYGHTHYGYGGAGYAPPPARDRYSRSPLAKSRSKSHGEHSTTPSTESLHNVYRSYGLPPLSGYVHFQEVSPSGMLPGARSGLSGGHAPAEYFQTPSPRPHSHHHSGGGGSNSSSASTAHPRSSDPGVRGGAHGGRHHKRNGSSGAGRYHSTSTDSLLQPYGFTSNGNQTSTTPINQSSSSNINTSSSNLPPLSSSLPTQTSVPSPLTPRDPKSSSSKNTSKYAAPAAVAVSDSEDEHYMPNTYYHPHQYHLRPHHSPSAQQLRGGSANHFQPVPQQQQQPPPPPPTPQTASYGHPSSTSARRRREREQRDRDRAIDEDRAMKLQNNGLELGNGTGAGGMGGVARGYEEDVVVGMGRYSGQSGSLSRNGGWGSGGGGGRRSPPDVRGGAGETYGLGLVGGVGSRMR